MNNPSFIFYLLPATLGIAVVMQSGLNRKIGSLYSLPIAVLLNSMVLTTLGICVYLFSRRNADAETVETFVGALSKFQWWYVIPGMLGYCLILGLPFSVSRVGALRTFLVLLVAQIAFSVLWDAYVEGYPITLPKLVGAAISLTGIAVVILSK